MPPKEKSAKDKDDYQTGSSSKDSSEKLTREQGDSQPEPNTLEVSSKKENRLDKSPPSEEVLRKSPVCDLTPDEIFEISDEDDSVVHQVKEFQKAKESFSKIIMPLFENKLFTGDLRKSLIRIINKKKDERSLSNIPSVCETEASKEVEHLKLTEEETASLCDSLDKDDYWDTKPKEISVPESETSSDSEVEMQECEASTSRQAPKESARHKPRRPSWKEYKKGKNFESAYFEEPVPHFGIKKVVKKMVKRIWRKKKQRSIEKGDGSSIEVGKDEVQDLLFDAIGFMENRRLMKAESIYSFDIVESDCKSGIDVSQDDEFPNEEMGGSRMSVMSDSALTSKFKECAFFDVLVATLPLTFHPEQTLEFVEVVKSARNQMENIVFSTAVVEPPPDLERLERAGAKDYMKQIPTQDDEESETKSISTSVEHRLRFKSTESESLSPMQSHTADTYKDLKFIDESSTEGSEDTVKSEASDTSKRGRSPVSPNTQMKRKSLRH